jgi:chromosome segregation ATPase
MSYVKRSVNLFLVLLIVGSVGTIAGLTLYYQSSFQTVTGEYAAISSNASACLDQLVVTQQQLLSAKAAVAENQEDVDKTVSLFEEKNQELATTQEQLDASKTRAKALETSLADRDKTIGTLNTRISDLTKEIDSLNDKIDELEDEIDDLESTCS